MYGNGKLALGIILGIIGAIALFCIIVGIGCSVNGLTFGEQIVEWFGTSAPVVDEVIDQIVDTGTGTETTTP